MAASKPVKHILEQTNDLTLDGRKIMKSCDNSS